MYIVLIKMHSFSVVIFFFLSAGYSVTDIDFISNKHGYATVLDSTQICSLLEYK